MQLNDKINTFQECKNENVVFTFFTLVTKIDEYKKMIESSLTAGFNSHATEYLYADNTEKNHHDGYSGFNAAMKKSKGKYLIYCHQDILFNQDKIEKLLTALDEIEKTDPKWTILGNAGKTKNGEYTIRITDPHGKNQDTKNFPSKVVSLDENFLIINKKYPLFTSPNMQGFHLYATDLCINAEYMGLSAYTIDFHLEHKSGGKVDASYKNNLIQLIHINRERRKAVFISNLCCDFFISGSRILNKVLNNQKILKLRRSINKKIKQIKKDPQKPTSQNFTP
jgi:hypothetical protein